MRETVARSVAVTGSTARLGLNGPRKAAKGSTPSCELEMTSVLSEGPPPTAAGPLCPHLGIPPVLAPTPTVR